MRFSDRLLWPRASRRLLVISMVACLSSSPVHANRIQDLHQLIESGDYGDALEQTDEMLLSAADNGQLLFIKASILEKMGKPAKAVEIYQQLTLSHPEMPEPFNNLAVHFAKSGDFDSAINILESAFSGHKSYATTYRNLQSVYERLASEYYRKALDSKADIAPLQLATLDQVVVPATIQPDVLIAANETAAAQNTLETGNNIASTEPVVSVEDTTTAIQAESSPTEIVEQESSATLVLTSENETVEVSSDVDDNVSGNNSDTTQETSQETPSEPVVEIQPAVIAETIEVAASQQQSTETVYVDDIAELSVDDSESGGERQVENEPNINEVVRNRVTSWAAAWSNQDLDSYLAHYSGNFIPRDNMSLADWKEQRRGRLLWREYIKIELTELDVDINGDTASASFIQHYESNTFKGTGKKTLKLKQVNGNWFITQELI